MNCVKAKDIILTDYLDGSLDQAKLAELEQHIRICAACQELQKQANALRSSVKNMGLVTPPESVWWGIRARLDETRTPWWQRVFKKVSLSQPVWAFSYAAATAAIIIAIFLSTKFVVSVPPALSDEAKLFNGITEANAESVDNFGTALEEYFL
jgi:anti-sigma factor RsiW